MRSPLNIKNETLKMKKLQVQPINTICRYCQKSFVAKAISDEEGELDYLNICASCCEDYAISHEMDNIREEIGFFNPDWSQLMKKRNMDQKLGARQYIKLEPAQKILNTLIMTLGSEWLQKNIDNPEVLKSLVNLAVILSDEMVEKLYNPEEMVAN
jgi:hypothetical protein